MGRGKWEEHFKVQGLMMAEMDFNFLFLNFGLFDAILIKYDVRWCWFNESEYNMSRFLLGQRGQVRLPPTC